MTVRRYDDAVIGAGIVGLSVAHELAQRGRRVVVFDRHPRPQGASVRSSGTIWPIGQPAGPPRQLAMRSRALLLGALAKAGAWYDRAGSLHLAYSDDEARVLAEFHDDCRRTGFDCELLDPYDALIRGRQVRPGGLQLALWSACEVCLDPRPASAGLIEMLRDVMDVMFEMNTLVTGCSGSRVTAGARSWEAERIWICAGDDLQTLFPQQFGDLGLVRCKLQMLRTKPFDRKIGPVLAAGLTLLHHPSFRKCPSFPALVERLTRDYPDHVRSGIHVTVAQNDRGELTIGESHEYGDAIEPFDRAAIETAILQYLDGFFDASPLQIDSRWHGHIVKHPMRPYVTLDLAENIVAITGLGSHAMTLAFGLAEAVTMRVLEPVAAPAISG